MSKASEKLAQMSAKLNELSEKDLESVTGGVGFLSSVNAGKSNQLYYNGQALPMNSKISELCKTYPELKEVLVDMYNQIANMTLNTLCLFFGAETIQGLIDEYSGK